MKKIFFVLAISLLSFNTQAQHTFSIVAVDTATGEIGSAGATCLGFEDGALAISDIILGTGAIHTQSFYNVTNQMNARIRMEAGDSPEEIMAWLQANDISNDPSARQYTAVDLNDGSPRSAAFTGPDCFAEFIHITGSNYAIAGNILISEEVVTDMETAFTTTTGTLADKLMAALQGAKRPGADQRCLDEGVSSLSAFIRVADPSDTDSSYGNLSLDLNVWVTGSIFEPIDALQDLYDQTLSVDDRTVSKETIRISPNPATEIVTIESNGVMINRFQITDMQGKIVMDRKSELPQNNVFVDISNLSKGVYFITTFEGSTKLNVDKLLVE